MPRRTFDTSIGGPAREFPTTVWSDVLGVGAASASSRETLDRLLRLYWKPVYLFIRRAWHEDVEDAKDLTQAFFSRLLERDDWARLDPDRGSFRAWLKTVLRHFLSNARRSAKARASAAHTVSLDAAGAEAEPFDAADDADPPERVFDRAWFRCLMAASLEDLESRLVGPAGRRRREVFRAYCIDPDGTGPPPTYQAVARRLAIKEDDVRNDLGYTRRLLRDLVRTRIRAYVGSEDEVESELREALGT